MIQRKCGTCKYFEEGGIAASGWCRHPERQALEHMVLVRKTELACRDGWDEDLWEPKEKRSEGDRAPTTSRRTVASSVGSSRSEISAAQRPDSTSPGVGADREIAATPVGLDRDTGVRISAESRDAALSAWSSAFTPAQPESEPQDELTGESVSLRGDLSHSGWNRSAETPIETGHSRARAGGPPSTSNGKEGVLAQKTPHTRANGVHREEIESSPVRQSGSTEPIEIEPIVLGVDQESVPEETHVNGETHVDEGDSDDSGPIERRQLPMIGQSKACCRNCRDFIPQEGGWRGWCSNPFAFEKRQLVDGDSIGCQSTVGSWWSPSDDWWMERADIAHHSAPTPLVDNLIREIRDRAEEERGSTEPRGRA